MVLLARTRGEPTAALTGIKSAVWSVDPAQPVDDVRTMEQYKYDSSALSLALLTLAITFAVFALVMAGLGIYGVMSYMVSERKAEISLRMALGAQRRDVLRMVLLNGGTLVTVGAVVGIIGALLLSPVLESMVVGVSARDPVTFIGVPVVLLLVSLVANYVPAFRATRVDPMTAMRKK
jgi:putative ABC transport system permease protein